MAILASPRLVFNLLLEGQDDKEEVVKDHPHGEVVTGDIATGQEADVVDDVQDEADSSQHDPRFHEADVPLKYEDFFVQTIFDKF